MLDFDNLFFSLSSQRFKLQRLSGEGLGTVFHLFNPATNLLRQHTALVHITRNTRHNHSALRNIFIHFCNTHGYRCDISGSFIGSRALFLYRNDDTIYTPEYH